MTEIQGKILDILKWFHGFCCQHDLTYYILGGTQLGAIRHRGFIPWDDDADVGMPRPDYERLLEITQGKMYGKYYVESIKSDCDDYIWPFAKVFDNKTAFVEKTSFESSIRGIWIDVFPLDGACNGMEEVVKYKKISLLKLLRNIRFSHEKNRPLWKDAVIKGTRMIKLSTLNRLINGVYSIEDFKKSDKMGNFTCGYGWVEHLDKAVWGRPTLYEFEDTQLYGVERADEYLRSLYGDYMTLPPPEKRVRHSAWFMDLEHGPEESAKLKEFLKDSRVGDFLKKTQNSK